MSLSPLPADTRAFLRHLDNHGLLGHATAAIALLAERGVTLPPALADELAQAVVENLGRQPGGLDHLFVASSLAPSDTPSASRPDGAEQRSGSRIRAHILAAHAGVPLRIVEGV